MNGKAILAVLLYVALVVAVTWLFVAGWAHGGYL